MPDHHLPHAEDPEPYAAGRQVTHPQMLSVLLFAAAAGTLAWNRLPRDLVALAALVAGVLLGIVPAGRAFEGFGDDVVVIVAATLLVSAATARSGVIETILRPALRRLPRQRGQLPVLATMAAVLASVMRGAAATLDPIAMRLANRTGSSRNALLTAVTVASTLGGLATLIGAIPNLIVARARGGTDGVDFALFDFLPVGLGVAVAGLLVLGLGYRFLPAGRRAAAAAGGASVRTFTAEARVPADSAFATRPVAELEASTGGAVQVATILRERFRRIDPHPDRPVREGDILLLRGEPDDLERLIAGAGLVLEGEGGDADAAGDGDIVLEGVVTTGSPLAGATSDSVALHARHGLALLGVSRRDASITRRLRYLRLEVGDLLILKGDRARVADAMEALRVLPLSDRQVALGARRRSWAPLAILGVALAVTAGGMLTPPVAFVGAAVAVLLLRAVTVDEAYRTTEWSAIVALAALLPLADAVRLSGASDALAAAIAPVFAILPAFGAVALTIAAAMAAAVVFRGVLVALALAPVAAALGTRIGIGADALLMAVAVGAGCEFARDAIADGEAGGATIGRRLAISLAIVVIGAATPLIVAIWGVRGG